MQYVRRKTKILQTSEVSSLQAPKNKETDFTNVKYKYALTIARISQDDALEKTLKREKIMFEKRKKSNITSCRKSKKAKCVLRIFPKREENPCVCKKKD